MKNLRASQIKNITQQIRTYYELNVVPIDLKNFIVGKLNGKIVYENIENGADAFIRRNKNSFEIVLNNSIYTSEERENFTLAHELGHLFLHMGYEFDQQKWESMKQYDDSFYRQGYSQEEFDANEFAANFLMPEDDFRKYIDDNIQYDDNNQKFCDFLKVANNFKVSYKSAILRAKFLGILAWNQ